jgi:hypothetical protein
MVRAGGPSTALLTREGKPWMAGTSPAMTQKDQAAAARLSPFFTASSMVPTM